MLRTAIDRREESTHVRHQRPVQDAGTLKAVPVVTYSLAGAQFGYDMLRTCTLSYPSIGQRFAHSRTRAQRCCNNTLFMMTRDEFENVTGVIVANCNGAPHAGTGRS